jgi:hypothetical protein
MKSLTIGRIFRLGGKPCDLILHQEASGRWHWLMTIPGLLVLSGSAPSESAAIDYARSAAEALAQLLT